MSVEQSPGAARHATDRIRLAAMLTIAGAALTAGVLLLLPIAAVTLFRARRFYAAWAAFLARIILRMLGLRVAVHRQGPWPTGQVVYVSNHPSTIDLFALVALGLPNTRFFLSGYLRQYVPLGVMASLMGTFFTVPQDRPAERVRIFQRADAILRRTRESVYLSPEGMRVTGGKLGHFNKGAFHLATSLRAPIQPIYFFVPPEIDPGTGFDARPGTVHAYVQPLIETASWRLEDVEKNRDAVRALFAEWHASIRRAHQAPVVESPAAESGVVLAH
jgi:1-acyl-sn-glycerol-3-phosphate acyltransferase